MAIFKCVPIVSAALLIALPALASAETLPASVAACAAETDVLHRLACYDREVARFLQKAPGTASRDAAAPAAPAAPAGAAAPAVAPTPTVVAPNPENDARHVAGHIVGLDGSGDAVIVHLDNGQSWQQVQKADATMSLRTGDRVTIDRGLGGTYWLAGPSQAVMQVKRTL